MRYPFFRTSAPRPGWVLLGVWLGLLSGCGSDGSDTAGEQAASRSTPASPDQRFTYPGRTMGTYANITLFAPDSLEALPRAVAAHNTFLRVDSLMSNWTATSEVARINQVASTHPVTVQPEVAKVIEHALRVGAQSDGAFDITVEPLVRLWGFLGGTPRVPTPEAIEAVRSRIGLSLIDYDSTTRTLGLNTMDTRIDLGGIAKGYGVDAATRVLEDLEVTTAMIEISGNIAFRGSPPGRETWSIGIRDPWDRLTYVGVLALTDCAVATSGKYEQFVDVNGHKYGHILNPRTGWPAEGVLSVTVVAGTAVEADAWGTAFFVLGPDEAKRLAKTREDLGIAIIVPGSERDTLWVEEDLRDRFTMEPQARDVLVLAYF